MKTFILASVPIAALLTAAPVNAQMGTTNQPAPGYSSLLKSDFSSAEREIRSSGVSPYDPARSINLGIALAKTGRPAEAEAAFRSVLKEDDVEMIIANGQTVMSHDLAYRALAALKNGPLSQ